MILNTLFGTKMMKPGFDGKLRRMIIVLVLIPVSVTVFSQPMWTIDTTAFTYSGDVNAVVIFNGIDASSGLLAAFVGDTCRGIDDMPEYSALSDRYYYALRVYSDSSSGDTLSFRYYNETDSLVYLLPDSIIFVSGMEEGTVGTPLEFVAADNRAPVVLQPVEDLTLNEFFDTIKIDISGVFSDPDGDSLTYSVINTADSVVIVSIVNDSLVLTEQGTGISSVVLTATDDGAGSLQNSDTMTVTVNDINVAPDVIRPIPDTMVNEGFSFILINLKSIFNDRDGDLLTFSAVSSNISVADVSVTDSMLTIFETGTGLASIIITADDALLTVNDTLQITVNELNDPPIVVSPLADRVLDEYFISNSISLVGVFDDPDMDTLLYMAESADTGIVSVSITDSLLILNEQGVGSTNVYITAIDDSLASVTDTILVTINDVNLAPVIESPIDDLSFNEGFGEYTIDLSAVFSDPDGDLLSFSVTSSYDTVAEVTVSGYDLVISEIGNGESVIIVTATDNGAVQLSVSDTLKATIVNVNDPPELRTPFKNIHLDEGFELVKIALDTVFTDPDGDTLVYSVNSSNASVVTASVANDTLQLFEEGLGVAVISVTASDSQFSIDDQFDFRVSNLNDPPQVVSTIEDRTYDEGFGSEKINLAVYFSDPDGDILSYAAEVIDTNIVKSSVSGSILTIIESGNGETDLIVSASDGALSVKDTVHIEIKNVNDAPVVTTPIQDKELEEYFLSDTIYLGASFFDPDNDLLTYTAESLNPGVVSVHINDTLLIITEHDLGTTRIILRADDGSLSVTDEFIVNVKNVNDAPVVISHIADRYYDEYFITASINLFPVFFDQDGDILNYQAISSDTDIVEVSINGTSLILNENGTGVTEVVVTADDGSLFVRDTFSVHVNNLNDAPEVVQSFDTISLDEYFGIQEVFLGNVFRDKDGDALTYAAYSSNESVVSVSVNGDTLVIYEAGMGISTIRLVASDGILSTADFFEVSVDNVNDAPKVIGTLPDRVLNEHFERDTILIEGLFNDIDINDTLTYSAFSSSKDVLIAEVYDSILVLSEAGIGSAEITLIASDMGLLSASIEFTAVIADVNDPPVVRNSVEDFELIENIGSAIIPLKGIFSDPDGDSLTYTVTVSDSTLVSATIADSLLIIDALKEGAAEVYLMASDTALWVIDTISVNVLREYLLIVVYDGERLQNGDSLEFCNDADQVFMQVNTKASWSVRKLGSSPWLVVSLEEDSTISIAFSENLTGRNRYESILIEDHQGHKLKFTIEQGENCIPDGTGVDHLPVVNIYPNPVSGKLYFDLTGKITDRLHVEVIDARGNILYSATRHPVELGREGLDMHGYNPGLYFIRLSDGEKYLLKKVMRR